MKLTWRDSIISTRRTVRRRLSVARAVLMGAALGWHFSVDEVQAQSQVTQGSWSTLSYTMPINPIHCGVMHSGKVLVVAGSENEPSNNLQHISYGAVWDPQAGTINVQNLLWDVFCNGMATFPDGRFLIVGGSIQYDPFYGEPRTTIFDPTTEKFNQAEDMAHGRWYATVTAIGDGRLMTFSGYNESGNINNAVEIYDVGSGWSPEYIAPWSPPLYPRMHLLPNGKVFYSGETASSHYFNPSTRTWTLNVAHTVYANSRYAGSSVLLPLRPQSSYAPRVLIMGGDSPATATAEIIDLSVASPAWKSVASMSKPRVQMNAAILPTGKVLAIGGSLTNEDTTSASLQADLFDSTTGKWSPAGVCAYPRLYHSVALLLPDATVWVAGGNPVRGEYEQHMEIYKPAYLFTTNASGAVISATRPTITSVPAEIGYGATFAIQTPNTASIATVVLMRPGASSHAFDMEQRLVELSFNGSAPGTLTATAPPNGFIAPPGYYMLFILNSAGVPSVAKFVHLTSTPTDQPPIGTITSPTGDLTIQVGGSISFASSATDPDGPATAFSWIFPGGTPSASALQSPGLIKFAEVGTNIISMTAIDGLGVNDPSPPTRTVIVQTGPVICTNTISTSSSPSGGGTTSGGGKKNCGSSVTVTATPNSCYSFLNWKDGSAVVGTSPSYTFTVSGNRTLVANFTLISSAINTSNSPSGGGSTSGGGAYNCGSNATVCATPNSCYTFASWTENGSVVSSSPCYGFTVSGNRNLIANYNLISFAITTSNAPSGGGTASGGGAKGCGSSVSVCATPNSGYSFANWTESGSVVSTSSCYTFTVSTNRNLAANFAACGFTLSATSASSGSSSGSGSVGVTASGSSCSWTASSNASWLHITGGSSGTGSGTIGYSVDSNDANCTSRTGTLTVAGQTFTITQSAGSGGYAVSPTSWSPGGDIENTPVNLTVGSGCSWAATSPCSWATVSPSGGTGNGTVMVTVDANPDCVPRSCTLTIGGQSFGVNQGAGTATYAVNPTSASVPAPANTGTVAVSAGNGCDWTAASSASWITVASGSASGSGVVQYSAQANPSASVRTGTVTIAGQTFTVMQSGSRYTLAAAVQPSNVGTVSVSPLPDGDGKYAAGTAVTLTASPAVTYAEFDSWSGDASGASSPMTINMDANKFVNANFVAASTLNSPVGDWEVTITGADKGQGYLSFSNNFTWTGYGIRLSLTGICEYAGMWLCGPKGSVVGTCTETNAGTSTWAGGFTANVPKGRNLTALVTNGVTLFRWKGSRPAGSVDLGGLWTGSATASGVAGACRYMLVPIEGSPGTFEIEDAQGLPGEPAQTIGYAIVNSKNRITAHILVNGQTTSLAGSFNSKARRIALTGVNQNGERVRIQVTK